MPTVYAQQEYRAAMGAFRGLVTWWLTSGARVSAEEIDRVFQRYCL